jgi:DNA polymerase elongation subunit (family B)
LDVIYGVVDSIFVKGKTMPKKDSENGKKGVEENSGFENDIEKTPIFEKFAKRVSDEVGIGLDIDCVFSKIVFPAARDGSGIANKYYGITTAGEMESRGIGIRRGDTPKMLHSFQAEAIKIIFSGEGFSGARKTADFFKSMVAKGFFSVEDLAVRRQLRRPIGEYVSNAPHLAAFRDCPNARGDATYVWARCGPKTAAHASRAEIDGEKYCALIDDYFRELVRGVRL